MSIKDAITHIHDKLNQLENMAGNISDEIYNFALVGIHRNIEGLLEHIETISPRTGAIPVPDAPPIAQNSALAAAQLPPKTDDPDRLDVSAGSLP